MSNPVTDKLAIRFLRNDRVNAVVRASDHQPVVQFTDEGITIPEGMSITFDGDGSNIESADIAVGDSDAGMVLYNNEGAVSGFGAYDGDNLFLPNITAPDQDGLSIYTQIPDSLGDGADLTPVLAGAGAGNLSNGVYSYKFTIARFRGNSTYEGETAAGTATPEVTVVDHTSNGKITVQLPYTCDQASGENVWIYRTEADGDTYKLVNSGGPDFACGNPYLDNVADADLGAEAPIENTTLGVVATILNSSLVFPEGDGFNDPVFNLGSPDDTSRTVEIVGTVPTDPALQGITIRIAAGRATGAGDGGHLELAGGHSANGTSGSVVLGGFGTENVSVASPMNFTPGMALQCNTFGTATLLFQAYDVDGAAYKTFATLTSGNTPDFTIAPPAGGTVTIQASTYKSSDGTSGATAGPFTTISSITVKNGIVTALTGS